MHGLINTVPQGTLIVHSHFILTMTSKASHQFYFSTLVLPTKYNEFATKFRENTAILIRFKPMGVPATNIFISKIENLCT